MGPIRRITQWQQAPAAHLLPVECDEPATVQAKVEVGVVARVHQVCQVSQVVQGGSVEGLNRQHGQLVTVVDLMRKYLHELR